MRSLLGVLTVVAIMLAVVLRQTELIIAAVAMVLVMGGTLVAPTIRRRRQRKNLINGAQSEEDESLKSVGIISITEVKESPDSDKPNTKNPTSFDVNSLVNEPENPAKKPAGVKDESNNTTVIDPESSSSPSRPKPKPTPQKISKNLKYPFLTEAHVSESLGVLLKGFITLLNANAVCVVRQYQGSCKMVGSCGSNVGLNVGEDFETNTNLLPEPRKLAIRVVQEEIPSSLLGYSRVPGSLKRVALAPIGSTPLILLADTLEKNGLTHPRVPMVFEQCAQLLGQIYYKEDPTSLRKDIVAEEVLQARRTNSSLALAAVLLRNAEEISEKGPEEVQKVESLMKANLELILAASRVVRLGELMFGVFLDGGEFLVELWAGRVHKSFRDSDDLLSGGVNIGIAHLSDSHTEGTDLSNNAISALISAYEKDQPAVIANPEEAPA